MRKKILFIYPLYSTFVKTDYEILATHFEVRKYHYKSAKGLWNNAIQFIRQFFFLLITFRKFDIVYSWFADYHSLLPVVFCRIFRKKSYLVIGGYDVARIKTLNYGVFTSKLRGFCTSYSMRHSTCNLAVSKYVERKVRRIAGKSNTRMVYNCVNITTQQGDELPKENLVITVGLINSERAFYLKGIDTFIETAKLLPDVQFMVIGADQNLPAHLLQKPVANLTIVGRVDHENLVKYYKKAKIYCQFSRSESFGVSIVEAMSFGCYPIVTNVGGMPELVKTVGTVTNRDKLQIKKVIKTHLENWQSTTPGFHPNLVIEPFLLSKRKQQVLNILQNKLA